MATPPAGRRASYDVTRVLVEEEVRLLLDFWLPVAVPVPRPVLDSLSFEGGSVMVLSELEEVRLPPVLEGVGVGCALVSVERSS